MKNNKRISKRLADAIINSPSPSTCTILLTMGCPASCRHCLFKSGPDRLETVDVKLAENYIDAVSHFDPKPGISFSGGDPFMKLNLLRHLVNYCFERNFVTEALTSGAWCKSESYTTEVLTDLKEKGLMTIATSIDKYHTEYVSVEKLRNCVNAGIKSGLKVVIKSVRDPNMKETTEEYIANILNMPVADLENIHLEEMRLSKVVGRAIDQTSENDVFKISQLPIHEPCVFSTDIITLTPNGILYPCCGMVHGVYPKKAGLYEYGNIRDCTPDQIFEMIKALRNDLFFRLIQFIGPFTLIDQIRKQNPNIVLQRKLNTTCDACVELDSNANLQAGLSQLLQKYNEVIS